LIPSFIRPISRELLNKIYGMSFASDEEIDDYMEEALAAGYRFGRAEIAGQRVPFAVRQIVSDTSFRHFCGAPTLSCPGRSD
jgi:hypothetical protein